MKICLIFGHDGGLDLDITLNLVSFYKKLGFKTIYSTKLYNADLLVVLRAIDKSIDLSTYYYQMIHVFDYVGWDYDRFLASIDHQITYIFCTAEKKRQSIIEKCRFPENHIFVVFPPVETSLWIAKEQNRKYDFVHIGNHKFSVSTDSDPVKAKFDKILQTLNVDVWGRRWNDIVKKELCHGEIELFNVPKIYAQSKIALGLMYPFQRDVTYSGRFWLAPLNGCFLISEQGLYTREIPGIIESNYTFLDIKNKINAELDKTELKEVAKKYWDKQYEKTLACVKPTLTFIQTKTGNGNRYMLYLFVLSIRLLKRCYRLLKRCY
jgi:hypothetical protein